MQNNSFILFKFSNYYYHFFGIEIAYEYIKDRKKIIEDSKMKTGVKLSLTLALVVAIILSFNILAFCTDIDSEESYNLYLIKSLDDENIGIRTSAAILLGERKVKEAIEPLVKMLKNEKHYSARIIAAVSLYKIGDDKILPILEKRAKKDKNRTVRHVLTGILHEIKVTQLVKL